MSNPEKSQMDTIWGGVRRYCRKDKDTCEILLSHIKKITKKSENKSFYAQALMLSANYILRDGRDSLGFATYASARQIFEEEGDIILLSQCDAEVGSFLMKKKKFKQAAEKLISAISLAKSIKDSVGLARPLGTLAGVYYYMGDLDRADKILEEAAVLAENFDNYYSQVNILTNKGSIAMERGDKYKELVMTDTIQNIQTYKDSSDLYYNKALFDLEKAMVVAKKVNNNGLIVGVSITMSILKNVLGEYKEVEEICETGLSITEEANDKLFTLRLKNELGIAQRNQGLMKKALATTQSANAIAKELKMPQEIFESNKNLYLIYKEMGLHENAMEALERIIEHQGEEAKLDTKKAIAEVEIKYEAAEKEKQILQQKNDMFLLTAEKDQVKRQNNNILMGGFLMSILGFIGYRVNKIRKDRNDKKEFAEALIFAQEEERKRIARDLHDGVGQSLLLIKKQLTTTTQITQENQNLISSTLEEVRSISRDLHPFQLEKFGLTATINDTIHKVEQSTELFITKDIENVDKVLPAKSEIHLYRTIQEALSNIVKHAEASAARVTVKNETDRILIIVQDNGKGFDLELAVVTSKSLGIRTMHERISAIEGNLKFEEGENGGTKLNINIPK
ncbi:MAG: histidine kinase [Saprospiraceae bacterium]